MSVPGLGCAKTKSDLVVMPRGRRIFTFFRSPHDHRPPFPDQTGGDFRNGSFATDAAGLACRFMSASVRKRPTSGDAAKLTLRAKNGNRPGYSITSSAVARVCGESQPIAWQF